VLGQDYPHVEILIRDDGSADGTVDIIQEYCRHSNVRALYGENIGVVPSFLQLLKLGAPGGTYFAFCDQDDIWEKDKLSRAVDLLAGVAHNEPTMYCSRAKIVAEDLRLLGLTQPPRRRPSFRNSLVQNIATGCTVLLNRPAADLLNRATPSHALMHDWWAYIVVSAFGNVIYDVEPRVLYRQHRQGVIGAQHGVLRSWTTRIRRFRVNRRLFLVKKQAEEFRRLYGAHLDERNRAVLDRFLLTRGTLQERLQYALSGDVWRQSRLDDVILRALFVLNRL
jgi:glycosyltransferase involved in cell wall biosynthesis